MYVNSGTSQPVVQDSGGAAGGATGVGLSELGITARGTGTPPYVGQGKGPNGTNACDYDAPINNAAGYHYLCWSANAAGNVGAIVFGHSTAASALPFNFVVNGTTYQFPFAIGGIVGPSTSVVGDLACWNNTVGTLLSDCGTLASIYGSNNVWTGSNNFTGAFKIGGTTETFPASGNIVGTSDAQTLTNKSIAASEINSGTLAAAQMPALTGDVTSSAGAVATTIAANVVTNTKLAQMAANSVKCNPTGSAANAQDCPSNVQLNCPHDGVTDAASCINTAISGAAHYSTLYLACGTTYIHSPIIFPALTQDVSLVGCGSAAAGSLIKTDQNISMVNVGTYTYSGSDDWSYSTKPVYFYEVGNLQFLNTFSVPTHAAINLNGALYGSLHDIICQAGLADCVQINPISAYNHIERIRSMASANSTDTIFNNAVGFTNNYNSTGNVFSDIIGVNLKRAIVSFIGCTFGDFVLANLNGDGIASGGLGSGGGAIAAVYLDGTGLCTDGATSYASRWAISNVKMDGTADTVVKGIRADTGSVFGLADGGGVTAQVSFDSTSSKIAFGSLPNVYTIATLPACNNGMQGLRVKISNGVASPTYNGAISTTGASYDLGECNGSGWVYK